MSVSYVFCSDFVVFLNKPICVCYSVHAHTHTAHKQQTHTHTHTHTVYTPLYKHTSCFVTLEASLPSATSGDYGRNTGIRKQSSHPITNTSCIPSVLAVVRLVWTKLDAGLTAKTFDCTSSLTNEVYKIIKYLSIYRSIYMCV